MKKKSLLIGLLVVAMSGMAVAQHTPVPDLASCPPTSDEYGTAIDWKFVPLPGFSIFVPGGPVNFSFIEGQVDFCGYTDMIFCSLALIGGALPPDTAAQILGFANLVQCLAMDINGPIDMGAEIPVTPNGILDASYELGILAELYNQGDAEVVAAYQANFVAVKNLIVDALAVAELKSDKDLRGIVQAAAPYLVPALSSVLAGFTTLGDDQTNAALDQLLLLLADIGLTPPDGGIAAITTGLAYLGPEGDADDSGNSNRVEYNYFVNTLEYSPAEYVAAALDPSQEPPAVLAITANPTGKIALGGSVTISVAVNPGMGTAVAYQWSKDSTVLTDETGSALSITNAQVADSGVYSVVVDVDAKAVTQHTASYTLVVLEFVIPVGGALGLVVLVGACAMAGVVGLRRRK
ncbi:MAG TPA: immunoglobulin domain-containing protein [Candidatus Hydrogenedentes bacterium]|nr:immunoglobulin domain-containing protein [Candidatus Hydrogenedentota bacterium]